ncbi:hypothetical protein [Bradyrhizobium iriomotense]|uniref:Uncharacterized protein n=1 Tax=Bradyrhizobium iriomotense TaxID=441950 RepID=A0ABQ6BAN8_9BRAD|nr:hypothetical protein [Bradyrhizobium iriomotense]GLR90010.1 hypothetical protein GCM10007857_67240 [Bradyrhizobium iriomotense]
MTMTVYGSSKSRVIERLNQAYRVMTLSFLAQLLRYFAFPFRVFANSSSVPLKADADPHISTAQPSGKCTRQRIQHLKQAIELQIEEVARLICEDKSAIEATRLLNALTSELVAAKLGMCPKLDQQAGNAVIGGDRLEQEHGKLYEPEQLSALGQLLDEAILALPPSMRTPSNRIEIAKLILERASITQVDPGLLIKLMSALIAAA